MPTEPARNWSAAFRAAIRREPAIQAERRPAATTHLSRGGSRRNRTRSRLLGIGDTRSRRDPRRSAVRHHEGLAGQSLLQNVEKLIEPVFQKLESIRVGRLRKRALKA